MATTADATFRIDGQDVDTLSIQGESVNLELYIREPSILRLGGYV